MDVLAGLYQTEVTVELGEWQYTIPALPASEWIAAVTAPNGGAIVPGLLNATDRTDAWRDFVQGGFDEQELAEVERDALEAAAGRPWWEADRLIRSLVDPENWPTVHGELMLRGLDLEALPLAAALNAVYALIRKMISHDEAALARFDTGLKAIPAGIKPEDVYDQAEAADDFLSAMAEQQQLFGG